MAVTAVALTYQWAETMRMARGAGIDAPNDAHASVYRLRARAFIGLPWPKNTAGRGSLMPPFYPPGSGDGDRPLHHVRVVLAMEGIGPRLEVGLDLHGLAPLDILVHPGATLDGQVVLDGLVVVLDHE